jgi:hypothetical protein
MKCAGVSSRMGLGGDRGHGGADMAQAKTWVGLDGHAAKVAIVDVESGELRVQRLSGRTAKAAEFCGGLPGPVRVSYEAGPTGFGLVRALAAVGYVILDDAIEAGLCFSRRLVISRGCRATGSA